MCSECVYQSILHRLGRLPVVRLQVPLKVEAALCAALQQQQQQQQLLQQQPQQQLQPQLQQDLHQQQQEARALSSMLLQRRALLADYFGLVLQRDRSLSNGDSCLLGLPLCCGRHLPSPSRLRHLLLQLATEVCCCCCCCSCCCSCCCCCFSCTYLVELAAPQWCCSTTGAPFG